VPKYLKSIPEDTWEAPQTESDEETASQAVMSSGIVGDIVETWRAHGEGRPTIARCVNRAHARDVAARFRASGFRAEHIDGTMSLAARSVLLARLAFGGAESASPLGLDVLCSGGPMLEEGFDSAASYRHQILVTHTAERGTVFFIKD
jgi:superfamily II DNA or RNA helicase